MPRKYGYKGTETAINGLLNWMDTNYEFTGRAIVRMHVQMNFVVNYAAQKYPDRRFWGHLNGKANAAAKHIQLRGDFQDFTDWFTKQPTIPIKRIKYDRKEYPRLSTIR